MPQLVKGGKHVYGWSRVAELGRIPLPPEALRDYCLGEAARLTVIPGSRTSGGFGLGSFTSIRSSPLGSVADALSEQAAFSAPEGEPIQHRGKPCCWVELRHGEIRLPPATLKRYGIEPGDDLLVIRGSGLALGLVVRGPIVKEARKHPELERFAAGA
jgi:hypothetical protein